MNSKCKYAKLLSGVGWCKTASMYCTSQQEATCKHNIQRITNADHIRGMTDKELAGFIFELCGSGEWPVPPTTLDWLQQEWMEQEGKM